MNVRPFYAHSLPLLFALSSWGWAGAHPSLAATRINDSPTSVAIDGAGWFALRDPATAETLVTRNGDFWLDQNGYVVTSRDGLRVQGFADAGLMTEGDVKIDSTGAPWPGAFLAWITAFRIAPDGRIVVQVSDGSEFVRSQILLQQFHQPQKIVRLHNGVYSGAAAEPWPELTLPGSAGLGLLRTNTLELEPVRLSVAAGLLSDLARSA